MSPRLHPISSGRVVTLDEMNSRYCVGGTNVVTTRSGCDNKPQSTSSTATGTTKTTTSATKTTTSTTTTPSTARSKETSGSTPENRVKKKSRSNGLHETPSSQIEADPFGPPIVARSAGSRQTNLASSFNEIEVAQPTGTPTGTTYTGPSTGTLAPPSAPTDSTAITNLGSVFDANQPRQRSHYVVEYAGFKADGSENNRELIQQEFDEREQQEINAEHLLTTACWTAIQEADERQQQEVDNFNGFVHQQTAQEEINADPSFADEICQACEFPLGPDERAVNCGGPNSLCTARVCHQHCWTIGAEQDVFAGYFVCNYHR